MADNHRQHGTNFSSNSSADNVYNAHVFSMLSSMNSSYSVNSDYEYNDPQEGNQGPFLLPGITEQDLLPGPLSYDVRVILYVVYGLIMVSAAVGNITVIVVITRLSKLRTVTNTFLLSLAASDLLIALINMPLQLTYYARNEWTLGQPACKISNYLQGVTIVVSIFTLTGIAVDRYYAICHPLWARHVHTVKRALTIMAAIWLAACVIMIPQLFIQRLEYLLDFEMTESGPGLRMASVCVEYFKDIRFEVAYTVFFYIVLYTIPVVIMFVTYGMIAYTLWFRQPIGESPDRSRELKRRLQEKKRIVGMLFLIVVVFAASWLPFFCCHVFLLYSGEQMRHYRVLVAFLQLVGYSNTLTNPLIYCFLNDTFKQNLVKVICGRTSRFLRERKYSVDTDKVHGVMSSTHTSAV